MIYTNKNGLPDYLFITLSHEWYGGAKAKHDFSVTQIGNPINMTLLQNRHKEELEEDVIDAYTRALGTGFHLMCEVAMKEYYKSKGISFIDGDGIEERRFLTFHNRVISGQIDLYVPITQKIVDYKVTKASSFIFGSREEKYNSQMNLNSYILRKNGIPVSSLEIAELYRDFDEKQAKFDVKYPKLPINIISIPMLTDAVIEFKLLNYIEEYDKFVNLPDSELPPCPPEERWERGGGWAVMKRGAKRAVKLCSTEKEAIAYRSANCSLAETYIEERPFEPIRCKSWCNVNKFCSHYQKYVKEHDEEVNKNEKTDNNGNRGFPNLF